MIRAQCNINKQYYIPFDVKHALSNRIIIILSDRIHFNDLTIDTKDIYFHSTANGNP